VIEYDVLKNSFHDFKEMLTAAGFNIKLIKQQTKKDTKNFKMQF